MYQVIIFNSTKHDIYVCRVAEYPSELKHFSTKYNLTNKCWNYFEHNKMTANMFLC